MAIDLIDDPELLDVEMDERVVVDPVVHRHLQERFQVVPVIVLRDRIEERLPVESLLLERIHVVINDRCSAVDIDLPFVKDPLLLFALEDPDNLCLFLDREIGIRPVRIVIQCDLLEKFPDRFLIGLNAAVDFDRIEERAFQLDHFKIFRICDSLITDPVFDTDDESSELLYIENADMIVGTEGTLVFADYLRNNALAEIPDLFR